MMIINQIKRMGRWNGQNDMFVKKLINIASIVEPTTYVNLCLIVWFKININIMWTCL